MIQRSIEVGKNKPHLQLEVRLGQRIWNDYNAAWTREKLWRVRLGGRGVATLWSCSPSLAVRDAKLLVEVYGRQ